TPRRWRWRRSPGPSSTRPAPAWPTRRGVGADVVVSSPGRPAGVGDHAGSGAGVPVRRSSAAHAGGVDRGPLAGPRLGAGGGAAVPLPHRHGGGCCLVPRLALVRLGRRGGGLVAGGCGGVGVVAALAFLVSPLGGAAAAGYLAVVVGVCPSVAAGARGGRVGRDLPRAPVPAPDSAGDVFGVGRPGARAPGGGHDSRGLREPGCRVGARVRRAFLPGGGARPA